MTKETDYRILGTVLSMCDGLGLPNLQIEAWDKDLRMDHPLDTAESDESGGFTIKFDRSYFQGVCFNRKPDINAYFE